MEYDYLIVGSGLFGSVFAHEATQNGKKCLVIDKRNHIGGNLYTEVIDNIVVHKYGAHIFHTDDKYIWDYINKFGRFNNYINSPLANYNGEIYNLPFNMNTFFQLWKTNDVEQVKSNIKKEIESFGIKKISNLEDQAISMIGTTLYYKLVKGYTEKQWGKNCKELPASIIKRLPLRFTYDNNYFNDRFQGVPIDGYTPIIEKMLAGSDLKLNTDYFDFIKKNQNIAKKIIYTGAIDEYYNYCYGELEYRSLYFDHKNIKCSNFQNNAVVNYTDLDTPYTRIIEHKHFYDFLDTKNTIITYEYPDKWTRSKERFYPINNDQNNEKYLLYKKLSEENSNVIFGGRLGTYKYLDMDDIIINAIKLYEDNN